MNKSGISILMTVVLLTVAAVAQQEPAENGTKQPPVQVALTNLVEKADAPTFSDVYCAGFITSEPVSEDMFIAAGMNTPNATKFADRDIIFLTGAGLQEGNRYTILRKVNDPNRYKAYKQQPRELRRAGQVYAEMGHVTVRQVRDQIGVAAVDFSCDGMAAGDIAVPYYEKSTPQLHGPAEFERFPLPSGKVNGRIIMAKDFDTFLGSGRKGYLNIGSEDGVKVGDYFRAVRDLKDIKERDIDMLSASARTSEDTQKNPPQFRKTRWNEIPQRALGEMIVLDVKPRSATVMVTHALEEIVVGDRVEMFDAPPPAPPKVEAPANPPSISCSASPATIRMGESSVIICNGSSPDSRPLTFTFNAAKGRITPDDNRAVLDTRNAGTGQFMVEATVTDDRNLSASTRAMVNVEAPPAAPTAANLGRIAFKANSAYVDNVAKAVLDDVALRLQRDPTATLVLRGTTATNERSAARLAEQRAINTKGYLTRSKGIDTNRVQTGAGAQGERSTEIWLVPAGAQPPQ